MPAYPRSAAFGLLAATAAAVVVSTAPSASATDGGVFSFPRLGTVVVDGTVDADVNFTVYRILDPTCTGTSFPGPDNSCVPQQAADTLVIPAGTYTDKRFRLSDVPDCGPTQQDVYEGAYQPTVTASGTHDYLAGGIVQLGTCTTSSASPSPTPSTSTPRSTPTTSAPATSTPSTSTPSTSTPSTSTPSTSTPPPPATTTPASTPPATATFSSGFDATADTAAHPATAGTQLASTGTDHTTTLLVIGLGAVAAGAAALSVGRTRGHRH